MSYHAAPNEPAHSADETASEPDTFDALFHHFHPRLVRFLTKRLEGSTVDAEDVAQESMVKAWRKREQFDERYQFSTWVYTIARRTAADHLRRRTPRAASDQFEVATQRHDAVERRVSNSDAATHVWQAAERILTSCQYSALWLRYGEDMSIKEVAKALSKTSVSTRVLLHRARTTLQTHLNQDDLSPESKGGT